MSVCDHAPNPQSGAYGHWRCERTSWHLGRHRFRNYTWPRVPRVWRVRALLRVWRVRRKGVETIHWGRHAVYTVRYEPRADR